jgi:hypothetical protein
VLAAAHAGSREAARLLLPLLHGALVVVADDFEIRRFELVDERANASIGALAVLRRSLFLGGQAIVPDGNQAMVVGTTIGTVLQPVMVLLVLALAWPAGRAELALRLLVAAALTLPLLLLDTPLSLAAWLWDAQIKAYEPGRASLLVDWNVFLNGGGRLALGLIAAALSIALAQRLAAGLRRA